MIEHTQEQIEDVKKLEAILTGLRNNNVDEADIDRDDYYCYVMHLDWVGLVGCAKGNAVLDNVECKLDHMSLLDCIVGTAINHSNVNTQLLLLSVQCS